MENRRNTESRIDPDIVDSVGSGAHCGDQGGDLRCKVGGSGCNFGEVIETFSASKSVGWVC